jgi:rubrerythrin
VKFTAFARFSRRSLAAILLSSFVLTSCTSPQSPTASTPSPAESTAANSTEQSDADAITLANLQTAYNGEANAHVRYTAFAEQAEAEGYQQVATLFRAAALAEQIHRDNHAKVIQQMGAEPQATLEKPEVKSTEENLQTALKGETYEQETMYPQFMAQARKAGNQAAVETFEYAAAAEREHATYYAQAKDNLKDWQQSTVAFYVCPECGYTTTTLDFENCPECGEDKEDFEKVT